jgi:hypothetical protein
MDHMKLFRSMIWVFAAVAWAGVMPAWAAADDVHMSAVLIWGTDGPKPADPDLKDLEEDILKRLKAVFKWHAYYEVKREMLKVERAETKRVRLSRKCEIEVENLGRSVVQVKLYGEGKLVVKKKQIMRIGELLVLAGEDKNDTAWFVALRLVNEEEEE